MDIFDSHQHCGDTIPGWGETFRRGAAPDPVAADLAGRLPMLDAHGIRQALMMPSMSYERVDALGAVRALNDRAAAFKRVRPDRFPVALGTIDLWLGRAALDEARRVLHELRLDGIAWHHRLQGTYIDVDRRAREVGGPLRTPHHREAPGCDLVRVLAPRLAATGLEREPPAEDLSDGEAAATGVLALQHVGE
jgi:predicted TIM-barrel fold metal-dependent hydrolase